MLSPLRNRFGIPGVISVIALVFAMLGGAYAASNSGGDSKATASAKGKPGPRGPRGKTGPAGPAGPAGPTGPAGAKGDAGAAGAAGEKGATGAQGPQGEKGATGNTGTAGAAGKSVTVGTENTGTANCEGRGGVSVEKEGSGIKTYACTGKEGAAGPAGPTCPTGECLLPVGATQTGVWSFNEKEVAKAYVSISFPLRLASPPTFHYVPYADQGTPSAPPECPGDFPGEPEALPGNFCMYEGEVPSGSALTNASVPALVTGEPDLTSGFNLAFTLTIPANEARGAGTWAVAR